MLKFTMCLHRKAGMSREEFQAYWYDNHGPLVKSLASALNIQRYVQLHGIDSPLNAAFRKSRGGPEPFDGQAEVWYGNMARFIAPFDTDEGKAAGRKLKEDEARFIDLSRSPGWISEERVILE